MLTYNLELIDDVLKIGFGRSAQNDEIVKDVQSFLEDMKHNKIITGGKLLKINGAASLPVAVVIAHNVAHLYGAIAVYDPKLTQYVVCITHNPDYPLGALID